MTNLDINKISRGKIPILALIVILFLLLDFFPAVKKIIELKDEIRVAKLSAQTLSESAKERKRKELEQKSVWAQEIFEFIEKTNREIQEQVKQDRNVPLMTLKIEDLASLSEIELESIRPLTAEIAGKYEVVPIEMGFKTTYTKLIKFLSEIEESSALIAIQKLSINKDAITYPDLDINLTFNVLFLAGKEKRENSQEKTR